jgi:hypothetical protein
VSDFGRLRSYDRFLIPVHAEPAGGSFTQLSHLVLPATDTAVPAGQFTNERQPVLRPAVAFQFKLKVISQS